MLACGYKLSRLNNRMQSTSMKGSRSSVMPFHAIAIIVFTFGVVAVEIARKSLLPTALRGCQPVSAPVFSPPYFDNSTLAPGCDGHDIPVVVLSHNNPTLVNLSVSQLRSCFNATVIIFDAGSDYAGMLSYLDHITTDPQISVIRHNSNAGPHTLFRQEGNSLFRTLPRFFAMTDPDLRLGDYTPSNFLCVLAHMTQRAKRPKAGVALDVAEPDRMWKWIWWGGKRIRDWELALYKSSLNVSGWPQVNGLTYEAAIDTTLAVYDKAQFNGSCSALADPDASCFSFSAVRLSGTFTALHRPWYPEIFHKIPLEELQAMYKDRQGTIGSQFSAEVYKVSSTWNASADIFPGLDPFVVHEPMSYKCLGKHYVFPTPPTGTPLTPF